MVATINLAVGPSLPFSESVSFPGTHLATRVMTEFAGGLCHRMALNRPGATMCLARPLLLPVVLLSTLGALCSMVALAGVHRHSANSATALVLPLQPTRDKVTRTLLSPRGNSQQSRMPCRATLRHKWGKKGCDFMEPSTPRGTTSRGKKDHFLLLDRYVQRIDALVPEDMEHLVKPLSWRPPQQYTSRTLKLTLSDEVKGGAENITEADVREFMVPLEPAAVALGWRGLNNEVEVYVQFETAAECQEGRLYDGIELGGEPVLVRFSVDNKFRRVCEDLGLGPEGGTGTMPEGVYDWKLEKMDENEPLISTLEEWEQQQREPPSVSETTSSEG